MSYEPDRIQEKLRLDMGDGSTLSCKKSSIVMSNTTDMDKQHQDENLSTKEFYLQKTVKDKILLQFYCSSLASISMEDAFDEFNRKYAFKKCTWFTFQKRVAELVEHKALNLTWDGLLRVNRFCRESEILKQEVTDQEEMNEDAFRIDEQMHDVVRSLSD